jgi:hypothetical protein
MNEEYETQQYGNPQQTMDTGDILNSLFRGISGHYINDKGVMVKDKNVTTKYCAYTVNKVMDYTVKGLTDITRQSRNEKQIIGFKSSMAYADLWKIFFDFTHECSFKEHCLRSKNGADFVLVVNSFGKVIDDSYRHSKDGFTSKLKHQNWSINENISSDRTPEQASSLSVMGLKVPIKRKQKEEREEL